MPDLTLTPAAKRAAQTPLPSPQAKLSLLITEAFGRQGEDVINPIGEAGQTCRWLLELFRIIQAEAEKHNNADLFRILSIAGAGEYIASMTGEYYDEFYVKLFDNLKAAKVIPADQQRLFREGL